MTGVGVDNLQVGSDLGPERRKPLTMLNVGAANHDLAPRPHASQIFGVMWSDAQSWSQACAPAVLHGTSLGSASCGVVGTE